MNVEILEAFGKKVEQLLGSGRSVYYEGFVPQRTAFPRTTIAYSSFTAIPLPHGGDVRAWEHIFIVNNVGEQFALEQFKQAFQDGDTIMDGLHGKQFSVTLANGRSITCKVTCQGGTSFRDMETKEAVVQHTYAVAHNG